jgi:hypothetical protein
VVALLKDHLAPRLIGRDPSLVEQIWRDLLFATHATSVGAITSLALAAVDTALWDWRCRRDGQPLWRAAGGAQASVPVYTTEGGWLHLSPDDLVRETLQAQAQGFKGAKVKVGKPRLAEDLARCAPCARRWATASRSWSTPTSASRWARRCAARRTMPTWPSPGSKSRCRPTTSRPPPPGRAGHVADRGGRIAVLARPVRRLRARPGLPHRAGRRGAHGRHHALAEGGAPGRVPATWRWRRTS